MQRLEPRAEDAALVSEMIGRCELFAGLSPTQVARMAAFVEVRHYEEGEVVIQKDDPGDAFFAISSGSVEVSVPGFIGERLISRLGAGDFFGELAILLRQPRSATVVCSEACEFFVLKSLDFEMLLDREPDIAAAVKAVAKARFENRP